MTNDATGESNRFDLRRAINAVSDVIQNRPQPLREFDQIYMKAGDMVLQTSLIAQRFAGRRVVFVGDGDSICLCLAYLLHREVVSEGPREILLLDFDERIVNAVARFADREGIGEYITARLYNCIDALPDGVVGKYDAFYTNPPWGASNDGESVKVFVERGMEACGIGAVGAVVIADDPAVPWTGRVLSSVQAHALDCGFFVQEMQTNLHAYHLDDAPDLKSCNLFLRAGAGFHPPLVSQPLSTERLTNFYGRDKQLMVQYVREPYCQRRFNSDPLTA